jgi:hypothetical protein
MYRNLILSKLNKKCITLVLLYWHILFLSISLSLSLSHTHATVCTRVQDNKPKIVILCMHVCSVCDQSCTHIWNPEVWWKTGKVLNFVIKWEWHFIRMCKYTHVFYFYRHIETFWDWYYAYGKSTLCYGHIFQQSHVLRNVIQTDSQVKCNNIEHCGHGSVHVLWCMSILFLANVHMILSVRIQE